MGKRKVRTAGVNPQQLASEEDGKPPQYHTGDDHTGLDPQQNGLEPVIAARTIVLTAKGDIRLIESVHRGVDKPLNVGGRGVSRRHHLLKAIDGGLDHHISKLSENGIPLVLRLAPDYEINVSAKSDESSVESSEVSQESSTESSTTESSQLEVSTESSAKPTSTVSTTSQNGKAPSTGDSSAMTIVALTTAMAFAVILMTRKRNNEK